MSRWSAAWLLLLLVASLPFPHRASGQAAPSATGGLFPNLVGGTERPMRYRAEGEDFVIENGAEAFNRPLYGGNTAFRVDGGDRPEFVLYLPGRGGNLRFGLARGSNAKWLHEAERISTRYRPGELLYEIQDPMLGTGRLKLEAIAYAATEGLIVRVESAGLPLGVELIWAYGGINGERGARDGDIGTERVPISQWFQLRPEFARGNRLVLEGSGFRLSAPAGAIVGAVTARGRPQEGDAAFWNDLPGLLRSAGKPSATPIVLGRMAIPAGGPAFLSLQRVPVAGETAEELDIYRRTRNARNPADRPAVQPELPAAYSAAELPKRFDEARAHFARLRGHVRIDTPDPYLNAAMGALNVAAEATWDDPQQAVMHGAIAWRAKLLGWRGPYWLDALGWPERADRHFRYWAAGQNTDPIPAKLPPADAEQNLARSEAALHSNGDLSNSHYDMNLVYIDALFRHLAWTGDLDLARDLWPMIERHMAWERRLFRRTFGPERLPLYEAYAAIWASDDLYYSGGGTAHASAYNYYHNITAARVARLIGKDPEPYAAEAEAIARGMRAFLWLPDRGAFAETKDLLGKQRVHPSSGLWTYYHVMDSGMPTVEEAWRMTGAVAAGRPFLPVRGPAVPEGRYGLYATTDWLPYSWSINNVVMQENLHTALGFWQAGRPDEAFRLTKSAILASMFMGISPGNLGTLTYLDVYRRESQRDFADGSGVMSRAVVEGLFGMTPDALAGEMLIRPGFPAGWNRASIDHPVMALDFRRTAKGEVWKLIPKDRRFARIRLRVPAPRDRVVSVKVDGVAQRWSPAADAVGRPAIELVLPGTGPSTVEVRWGGDPIESGGSGNKLVRITRGDMTWLRPEAAPEPRCRIECDKVPAAAQAASGGFAEPVDLSAFFNDRVTNIFAKGKYLAPRSPHVSLSLPWQGLGAWAGHVNASAEIDDSGLRRIAAANGGRLVTPSGIPFTTPAGTAENILLTSLWKNYPEEASVPLSGRAVRAHLLMAGTTNFMQSRFSNGEVVIAYADGSSARLPLINPDNWWPIEQDYFTDDYQFRIDAALPQRVDLKTGLVRVLDPDAFKGKGRTIPGGAATLLEMPLDPAKPLRSITVRTTANDVVIGLMAVTLERRGPPKSR